MNDAARGELPAVYYDGTSSRRHAVRVRVDASGLAVDGEAVSRRAVWAECEVSERTRHGPRVVRFADGAQLEFADGAAFDAAGRHAGRRDSLVVRLQQSWRAALLSVLACVLVVAVGYRWGMPWAVDMIAARLPEVVHRSVGMHVMEALDRSLFKPTRLEPGRQARLQSRFDAMRARSVPGELLFRQGGQLGANAVALPSGQIIVTDQLAELLDDDQVMAVVAHELGHVAHRHGMRAMLQNSIIAAVAAWYLNDISPLLAGSAAVFANLQYSRAFEYEADAYGARLLHDMGMSPMLLGTALETLAASRPGRTRDAGDDYLSTHPATAERVKRLGSGQN